MSDQLLSEHSYHRYHIQTETTPDIVRWPSRFLVKVNRVGLARLLLSEVVHFRGDLDVVLNRPCMYGVFSGRLGGFTPREELCVGCLRCTTQHPEFVQIRHNPAHAGLGDSYFTGQYVNAVAYEARTGRVPVKGAGYRGLFGGEGWDGMWTDMSEIVRPTRDGIHGREFISTKVDLGGKPSFLSFDASGAPYGALPVTFSIPLPFIFDPPPVSARTSLACRTITETASQIRSLAVLPLADILKYDLRGEQIVPLLADGDLPQVASLPSSPKLIELDGWSEDLYAGISNTFPDALIGLRDGFADPGIWMDAYERGVRIFHLVADYHGQSPGDRFIHDTIRDAHLSFVSARIRDEVTMLGSGGIIAAEHVPKAIIAGLDVVALDTAPLVALQAEFDGECRDPGSSAVRLPANLNEAWGVQRLMNMSAAWRDQLLEILGAMGLREVRRLRGETGRAMYQVDLEREAFSEIEGYNERL